MSACWWPVSSASLAARCDSLGFSLEQIELATAGCKPSRTSADCGATVCTTSPDSGVVQPRLWLHFGQICNALAGPVSASIAPAFAAVWFPAEERTLATSLIWTCSSAAPSLGFAIALPTKTGAGLMAIMFGEAASSLVALAFWLVACPKLPRHAPSSSAAAHRAACGDAGAGAGLASQLSELLAAMRRNRFWLLAVCGGTSVGAFQCWSASLSVLFAHSPFPAIGDDDMGKLLGLVSNGGTFFGTLAAAPLADRFFRRRFKRFLIIIGVLQVALLAAFSASVPDKHGQAALPIGALGSVVVLTVASVLFGLGAPVCFELGAELTFPAHEGVSSSAYSFTMNVGGFVLIAVLSAGGSALTGAVSCALMAVVIGLCLVMLLFVPETYPRLTLDSELFDQGCAAVR